MLLLVACVAYSLICAHHIFGLAPPTCATGSVLELLDTKDLELRLVAMAALANVLAFSDTLLLSREECINAVRDRMDVVVDAIERCDLLPNRGWLRKA